MTVTCLIPFYNEGERIIKVLEELSKTESIDNFVCVNDGSTDCAEDEIKRKLPHVKVISLEKNMGKSDAVKNGLKHINGEFVLLIDADLRELNYKEIETAVEHIKRDETVDMIVFRRVNCPWPLRINKLDVLTSGERILKTEDLKKIYERKFKDYQLEFAINTYMTDHMKKVFWAAHSGLNTHKFKKRGFFRGIYLDGIMLLDLLSYAGIRTVFSQFFTFARKPIE